MQNIVIGIIIGFLLGSFLKVGVFFWLILGAVSMYIAFKKQFIR